MKWAAEHIPSCVTDDIVYSDGGQDYRALGGQIVPSVGASHVHSLVKLVVTSNKVEVFRHLVNKGFSLQPQNLIFLACQHGCETMVTVLMETKVSFRKRIGKAFFVNNSNLRMSSLISSPSTDLMLLR